MKKKLLLLFVVGIATLVVYAVSTHKSTEEKLKQQHANFLENHPYNETLELTKKERKANGMPPNKYFEQEYLLEMNPSTGRTHPENFLKVQQELKSKRKLGRVPGDGSDNKWIERGPNNVGGRTRVVLFDPNDATHKRVFAGGVSGGLWVNNDITDANSSWTPVGIDENLSISCMTVDPNNSQIMYVGTGESYTGNGAVGNGVWKSIDGGAIWTSVLRDDFNSNTGSRINYINDIIAWNNPSTSKTEILVSVARAYYREGDAYIGDHGLWKTTNDGTTWSELDVEISAGSNYIISDFEIGADNTIWAGTNENTFNDGGGTILKSVNGTTFTVAHTITNGKRTEIAVSKTDKDKIYAICHITGAPQMLVTTNGFTSITNITTPADASTAIPNIDFTRGQGYYDLVIEVDPTNDNIVYVGGIDLFRSTNNGANWKQISKWHNYSGAAPNFENDYFSDSKLPIPTVHGDQHSWAFHPTDANKAIIGNDGGVFYAFSLSGAETSTTVIEVRNKDYNITQFYNGAIGQNVSNEMLIAGAQDNGSQFVQNASTGVNSTVEVYDGDGAYSFIDKDGEYMIVSYTYNTKARLDLPYTGAGIEFDNDRSTGSFINPQELDNIRDFLYANASGGGKDSIARYIRIKSASPIRTNISHTSLNGEVTALKVSPFTTTSTKLFVGLKTGRLLRIDNANTSKPVWNITGLSVVGSISSINFGNTENEIMVTYHNYGVESIWYTTDGGTTWLDKEGDFPDIPVKAIMMNPLNNNEVIIGTQLGVWRTSNFKDASPTWVQSYDGMSNVKVTSFSLRAADNTVMATTYGRGMFTGKFTSGVASVDDVLKDNKVFTMYPTVSSGEFTVFAKNTLGKAKLQLFDINGREVHTQQVDFTQQERQSISVNLTSGVYIVNLIDTNNKKATSKVIIK